MGAVTLSIKAQEYYCQIPEFVLYADISAQAVRLYGVLHRAADKDSKRRATPSRAKLAEKMRCSVDTVDRAMKELVRIGAVEIRYRLTATGDQTSNDYLLKVTNRGRSAAATPEEREEQNRRSRAQSALALDEGGRTDAATPTENGVGTDEAPRGGRDAAAGGGRTDAATGGRVGAAQSKEEPYPEKDLAPRRASDEIWNTLSQIFGEPQTRSEKSARAKVVRELVEVEATPSEIGKRFRMFSSRFPGASCTAFALVKHWSQLSQPKAPAARPNAGPEYCKHRVLTIAQCEECEAERLVGAAS